MDVELDALDTGLFSALGLRMVAATADRVAISWTVDQRHLQPFGIVHGGVHCSVHETAASIGAQAWLGKRGHVVGVSNLTDFLRPTRPGDKLTAVATPVHQGRSQQLWVIETRDGDDRLVARGQVRLQNLAPQ